MEPNQVKIIEMKIAAGIATPAEIAALAATPIFIGGGAGINGGPPGGFLVIPRPCLTDEEYEAKFGGHRILMLADPPTESPTPPKITRTADGLMMCNPADEPDPRIGLRRVHSLG